MKYKDSVFLLVTFLAFALVVLSPFVIDTVLAPETPLANVLSTWLAYGENFVASMVYGGAY